MTHRPPLLTLLASLAVHAVALAVLFLFASGEPVASVLVIDLSALESGSDRPGPRNEPASSARPSRRERSVGARGLAAERPRARRAGAAGAVESRADTTARAGCCPGEARVPPARPDNR